MSAYTLRYRDQRDDFETDDRYVLEHVRRVTSGNAIRLSKHTLIAPRRTPVPARVQRIEVVPAAPVHQDARSARARRLQEVLAQRPTLILDRGYQVLTVLLAVTLVLAAFATAWVPVGIAAVLIGWGSMIFVDATIRGKSVFDVRVATLAIILGFGTLVMAVIGLAQA